MKIVYGPKGTGKTKIVIDEANGIIDSAKGHVVFITDTKRYTYDLKYQIRFLDVTEFDIGSEETFEGFIKGIVAANSDNEFIYIDGIARITKTPLSGLEKFFEKEDMSDAKTRVIKGAATTSCVHLLLR